MKFPALFQRLVNQRLASSFRHLFLVFLLFTIHYSLFTIFTISPVSAQAITYPPNTNNMQVNPNTVPNTNPDVPKNLHTYTQNVAIEIMAAITCQLTGIDPVDPNQACLGVDQKTGKIGFMQQSPAPNGAGGAIGVMSHMISVLYTAPLHTGDYFNYLADNFGITKKAYAQGTGFEGLKPLLGLWTAFRNIVYLIFTIVFVVIGLAIMFRVKIDPRTVMTIQNQIPKIIVGIVLVTFSYAIAGFLIDMMYSSIYLIGNVITSAGKASPNLVTQMAQSTNPLSAASLIERTEKNAQPGVIGTSKGLAHIAWEPAEAVGGFIKPIFDNAPGKVITGVIGFAIGTQVRRLAIESAQGISKIPRMLSEFFHVVGKTSPIPGGPLLIGTLDAIIGVVTGTMLAFYADDIAGFVISLIAFLIISIAILWSLFRLWFTLIIAYIYILIDVVFAPFWIAGGIIPGQPVTFGGWLRHILSYIAAFPTTIALFLLGKVFIDAFGTNQTGFVPPLVSTPDTNAIGAIIGLGIILMSSNVVNITTKLFKAPSVDVGSIGQAIGVGVGVPKAAVGSMFEYQRKVPQIGTRGGFGALFGRMFGR